MVKSTKYVIGILLLVILTSSIYILSENKVRIDVEKTKTTFKVWENNSWVLAGTEYTKIYDGTTLMRANERVVNHTLNLENNQTTIYRYSYFKDNILVIDTYEFDGNVNNVELVPVSHKINVINGQRKIIVYEVNDLLYTGETIKDISSPQAFGHNMKVEWESGNYYSRIWKYANKEEGKLTIKYRVDSDDYSKNVRLFDPLVLGTNCGFVTTAPTADPAGTYGGMDDVAIANKDISPANVIKVTEIGWWCDSATPDANFEVGIYNDDSGAPGSAVARYQTNAKGTTAGWKRVAVDIPISPSTTYWIAVQLDTTYPDYTGTNYGAISGRSVYWLSPAETLDDPWSGGEEYTEELFAFYALVEVEAPPDTCTYTSGNWNILCSDYCNITSNVAASAGTNNITITGNGMFTTTANITGFKNFFATGGAGQCTIRCLNGGCFK